MVICPHQHADGTYCGLVMTQHPNMCAYHCAEGHTILASALYSGLTLKKVKRPVVEPAEPATTDTTATPVVRPDPEPINSVD